MIPLRYRSPTIVLLALLAVCVAFGLWAAKPASAGPGDPADKPVLEQLRELRERLARLEATIASHGAPGASSATGAPHASSRGGVRPTGGGMMEGMGGGMEGMMKMMEGMQSMMRMMGEGGMGMAGAKPGPGRGAMGAMQAMEAMDAAEMGMGPKPHAAGAAIRSTLPGFPGASHLYHIGATGFFLDHSAHITLSTEQEKALNGLKERALLEKGTALRKIEEAEQQLWSLTAADTPNATEIEAKVREIEGLRSEQRLSFIRAVGEAAQVLTPAQRGVLAGGAAAPAEDRTAKDPHAGH